MKNEIVIWFKNILRKYCNVILDNFIRLIFLEMPSFSQKIKNTCLSLMATYIVCMWNVRNSSMNTNDVIKYIKGEISSKHRYIEYAMQDKFNNMVTEKYCSLNRVDI